MALRTGPGRAARQYPASGLQPAEIWNADVKSSRALAVWSKYRQSRPTLTVLRASLAFYRGRAKVFETPVIERTVIDDPDRKAAVFQLQVGAADIKPGLYTCQVNVIDEVAGRFAFPRLAVYVKGPQ